MGDTIASTSSHDITRQHYLLPLLRINIIISRRPIIIIVVASITYYVLLLLLLLPATIAPHKNTCAIISIIIIIANTKRLKVGSNTKLRYFLFLLLVCYF